MAKTLDEKIEATKLLLAKYEAQKAAEAILNNIQVGDDVSFKFGRGDKARVLEGAVVAVGEVERLGLVAAIQSGTGLDMQTYKVRVADIIENRTAADRDTPAAEGATSEVSDEQDPLDNAA